MSQSSAATAPHTTVGVNVDPGLNITDLLTDHLDHRPETALFGRQLTSGEWTDVTAREFHDDVTALAKGLIANGVKVGDSIAIMSATRYEWSLLDFAIWYAGAVTVPIYDTSSTSQIAWILEDSDVKIVFVESDAHLTYVDRAIAQENVASVENIIPMHKADLQQLRDAGTAVDDDTATERRSAANLSTVATIIYTSGTTGKPKGCELTHGNFVELTKNILHVMKPALNADASTVLFIPLAHVFARFISVACVGAGTKVGHTSDIKDLVDDLGTFRPTFLLAVPRVFEKIYNAAMMKAEAEGKGSIFKRAADTAVQFSEAQQAGKAPLGLKLRHALFSRLVYSKLKARMGGRVEYAVSGGSPLGARMGHFFNGVGVKIMEGYGLTETTAPITVNTPEHHRIGTVGKALPGCEIAIAEDGEVLGRGVCVFKGYRNRADLRDEAFTPEGWFRTGDLGQIDGEGYLSITGRKKEILVTTGGKNVAPAQLEDQIRSDAIVSQVVVVGDQRPFVAALITLDSDTLPPWLERMGLPKDSPIDELTKNATVLEHLQAVVDKANSSVSRAESIREFTVLASDFTIESGHLTPSLKMRRPIVLKDYAEQIDTLYSEAQKRRAEQG